MSNYSSRNHCTYREKDSKAGEPVRTLFIRGLPSDVKSREVYNLFRPYEGFQSASISYPGEQKIVSNQSQHITWFIISDIDLIFKPSLYPLLHSLIKKVQ